MQLPTYDGTKSYQNLLVEVYKMKESNSTIINSDSAIQLLPISFIRLGYYNYVSGYVTSQESNGGRWQADAHSDVGAKRLYFGATALDPQNSRNKGYGFPLRCLVR